MKKIYIILTKSDTIISKVINRFTGEPYTHAAIAFDSEIREVYSFGRFFASLPLPAGLKYEDVRGGFYKKRPNMPCALLAVSVEDEKYYAALDRVHDMMACKSEWKYSILGLILCSFQRQHEFRRHYFCSQFVAKVLVDVCGVKLPKSPSLTHPSDFLEIEGVEIVHAGELGDVRTLVLPRTACVK